MNANEHKYFAFHLRLDLLNYPSATRIARAQLNLNAIVFYQTNPIPLGRPGSCCQEGLPIVQFQPVQQAGEFFHHPRYYFYGRVRTHGPFFVTATQCSK